MDELTTHLGSGARRPTAHRTSAKSIGEQLIRRLTQVSLKDTRLLQSLKGMSNARTERRASQR